MFLTSVNIWAVLVATVVAHIIGFLWYGPLFGKSWMKMMNYTKDSMKNMSAMGAMTLGFIGALITNYILAVFLGIIGVSNLGPLNWSSGAMAGFLVWLGFAMPLHAGVFLWEGKPFKLFIFNTLQYLISIVVASSIIGAW